ncbi:hypothetical protein ACIRNI_30975 [Streptomyces sp. NPDC093546]|uniref:hypothetical protein n=1 Tax=Streptomyces sp. NPDC093546 TaxID=3366040 RepID=UPI003830C963
MTTTDVSRPALPLRNPGDALSARTMAIAEHGWHTFVQRHRPASEGTETAPVRTEE